MDIIIILIIAFTCRNLAIMTSYCLTYGQVFGFIKIWLAKKIDSELLLTHMSAFEKQSEGEEKSRELYDILCDYKSNSSCTIHQRSFSFILSLLDCSFCIGFWISFIAAFVALFFGIGPECLILIPTLTFFLIEKV